MGTSDDSSLIWPSHIWHELFQVVQRWLPLQKLLVQSHGEVELHDGEIVDGQTADDSDEVEQLNVFKGLQHTMEMEIQTFPSAAQFKMCPITEATFSSVHTIMCLF